jgi:hypothetical protein
MGGRIWWSGCWIGWVRDGEDRKRDGLVAEGKGKGDAVEVGEDWSGGGVGVLFWRQMGGERRYFFVDAESICRRHSHDTRPPLCRVISRRQNAAAARTRPRTWLTCPDVGIAMIPGSRRALATSNTTSGRYSHP